jgi:hypothetical protein
MTHKIKKRIFVNIQAVKDFIRIKDKNLQMKTRFSLFLCSMLFGFNLFSQNKVDSLTDELKTKILNTFQHFSIGFYVDAYYNVTLDRIQDTSNLIPYSANCPVADMIRINHGAFEIGYSADKVRGKLALQWGDAPNLLATADEQFIKNLRQANFGFRIVKDLWIDFGYMLNPVGYESSWAVINQISTVTVGGYFEPGNILGIKLSYQFSPKVTAGILVGNPFSLAYGRNTHFAGITFIEYRPFSFLKINYNNFFGNQALMDAQVDNNLMYNNLIVTYNMTPQMLLVGQFDMANQTNSTLGPDSNRIAYMYSGFLQYSYTLKKKLTFSARYEFFKDRNGFLSGPFTYNHKVTGLTINGVTLAFEYKPVKFGYIRLSYRFLHANPGNKVYYSGQLDHINLLTLTTGVRF